MSLSRTNKNWNQLGIDEPLWSILNDKNRKGKAWETNEFFQTGEKEINDVLAYLKELPITLKKDRALDFGCGVGRLTRALKKHFREVHGVDAAVSMIKWAKEYDPEKSCHYHVNTENNLSLFENNAFNFVYSNITLQHMEPIHAGNYIKEFIRIIKPTGVAIFQIPSEQRGSKSMPQKGVLSIIKNLLPSFIKEFYRNIRYGKKGFIEMFGTPREKIIALVSEARGHVIDIKETKDAGENWTSYRYTVKKSS